MESISTICNHSIISFRDNYVTVADPQGKTQTILVICAPDATLAIADAENDIPAFVHRFPLEGFPTQELILSKISEALGSPQQLIQVENQCIELDKSALRGLKKMPVDIFDDVYLGEVKNNALILCVDIRNFSSFLCCNDESEVFRLIKEFTSNLLSCVNQFGFGCNYYKLMGDGAIVIWDETDTTSVQSALGTFDAYIEFANEELFAPYPGLGMAGALVTDKVFKYEISAEASQLKYRDYVGYGINLSCRLQALAHKDQLVINHNLANTGLVPFILGNTVESLHDLTLLKGLKEEDRDSVLFYAPER
jgi:class 3 adenylate cyclase